MSAIPPPSHAGLIQTHGAQRTAGEQKAREVSKQAQTQTDFSSQLKDAITNDDLDSQVFADGQGAGGGQGRASQQPEDDAQPTAESEEPQDQQPDGGIDLTA